MQRWALLGLAAILVLLIACDDAGPSTGSSVSSATALGQQAAATAGPSATALVLEAVQALLSEYYEELDAARLFADAWEGAVAALRAVGVESIPTMPAYPRDPAEATALHQQSFRALEQAAVGRLDDEALAAAALHTLAVRRDDPHTSYRSRGLVQRDQATRQGEAAVQLGAGFSRTEPPRVVRAPPGSPAERAGLRAGQTIVAVNGTPVTNGADISALVDVREGVANTFTVRDATGVTEQYTVIPARYVRPIEEHEVIEGRIGVVRLYGFPGTQEVVRRLREALLEFERQGVEGWVLDLRDNGGGPVETVIAVASLFVERGPLFEERQRGRVINSAAADGSALTVQRPLVVLVGPGSFSGGEILPAVLQARGRAVVVGEQTGGGFGSSTTVPLPDGSALNVTTTEVAIGPEGRRLNRVGLTPDVVVPRTLEDVVAGRDPQMGAAVRMLAE
ncbi:MAG: S41 family peptidase [Dehalococcoidia bacterium]